MVFSSEGYWIKRYEMGGNSGDGSYNQLAVFKAEVINQFVKEFEINKIIEFGCGDGNQLKLAEYPSYIGFDISPEAINLCNYIFRGDPSKSFYLMREYGNEHSDLSLSLDVIFHLVEDKVFCDYMQTLLDSSNRYVIIYSSDTDDNKNNLAPHVRHRKFSEWILVNKPEWKLDHKIANKYPFTGDTKSGSFSDFYFYKRISTNEGVDK